MEQVWSHAIHLCTKGSAKDHPVLLTEGPCNPQATRERMAQSMFESHEAPSMFILYQNVLSLLAGGKVTGTIIDAGEGVTSVVPIYEGYKVPHVI